MSVAGTNGRLVLVGAGPGDPDLLTVRAYRWLRRADVVLYDSLVHEDILALCAGARLVHVGKEPGGHSTSQDVINRLLVREALDGHVVVRLKGGDPYVFGRGSEEAIFALEHGVEVEVVPGISSSLAVPGAAGIPLTHRKLSTQFTVITGQAARGGDDELEQAWVRAAQLGGTLVFMMGVRALGRIVPRLLEGGLSPETPAAAVMNGTRDDQRVVVATIATLQQRAREEGISSPSVIVVGEVVRLREALAATSAWERGSLDDVDVAQPAMAAGLAAR